MSNALASRISLPVPWLLDGPTGTELERRGYETRLPLWTALAARECPALLRAVHDDYVRAGADVITACTFRTSRHALSKAGLADEARALTREAVALARDAAAASPRPVRVAGSVAPLEDCYCPERTPDLATLEREHALHTEALVEAGVDLLLVETMPTAREAFIAARAAIDSQLPVALSFIVRPGATLYDGTPLGECLDFVHPLPLALLSVNCCSVEACTQALPSLWTTGRPFGAYANSGEPDGTFGFKPLALDVDKYAAQATKWLAAGAEMLGGCCGTTPEHILRLRMLIDEFMQERQRLPGGSV